MCKFYLSRLNEMLFGWNAITYCHAREWTNRLDHQSGGVGGFHRRIEPDTKCSEGMHAWLSPVKGIRPVRGGFWCGSPCASLTCKPKPEPRCPAGTHLRRSTVRGLCFMTPYLSQVDRQSWCRSDLLQTMCISGFECTVEYNLYGFALVLLLQPSLSMKNHMM